MHTLARLGLVILAIAFGVGFLFEVLRFFAELNESPLHYVLEDVGIGLACAAGFAACSKKYQQIGVAQRAQAAANAAASSHMAFSGSRLEADANKLFSIVVFLIVAAIFLLPCFLVWIQPAADVRLIILAVLGPLVVVYLGLFLLANFRAGKPTLVMDAYAFDHAWYGPIRWDQVLGMRLLEIKRSRASKQYVLTMCVAKPGRYLQQMPWVMRMFLTRQRLDAAVGDLRIPLNILNQPAALIKAAALTFRRRVSPPLLEFWSPGMSAEQVFLLRDQEANMARLNQVTASLQAGAPITPEIQREIQRLADEAQRQTEAAKPFVQQNLARARRVKYQMYALLVVVVLLGVLRVWLRVRHPH